MTETPTLSRRGFLRGVGSVAVAGSLAGCYAGGGGGGGVRGPVMQSITRDEADVTVDSAADLVTQIRAGGGRIVWIDSEHIDLSGRNLTLENVTLASGRGEDATGAVITTSDRGVGTPVRQDALIELGENARLSGVTVRGPLWDYTDSPIIPGYVPFAPGSNWDVREQWRNNWYCRGLSVQADSAQVDNCEIWGWSTGIMVGARNTVASPRIMQCFIHNCMMTSAGYPIDVKRGTPVIYQCVFDAYRHALNGFGYADAGYLAVGCVFGPHASSHVIDMHGIHNNARDGGSSDSSDLRYRYRAGGTMLVRNCQIMATRTVTDDLHNEGSGYINQHAGIPARAVHIRAVPADGFYFEGNQVARSDPTEAVRQSSVPSRYETNQVGWHNIHLSDNQWGVDFS